jgi:hypothetical protein
MFILRFRLIFFPRFLYYLKRRLLSKFVLELLYAEKLKFRNKNLLRFSLRHPIVELCYELVRNQGLLLRYRLEALSFQFIMLHQLVGPNIVRRLFVSNIFYYLFNRLVELLIDLKHC